MLDTIQSLKQKAEEINQQGNLQEALQVLQTAEILAIEADEPLALALVWRGRANIFQQNDRFQESLAATQQAVALYEQSGEDIDFEVAQARTIEVYVLGALGRFDEAISLAKWIDPLFERRNFFLGLCYLTANLARVYMLSWQLADALQTYEKVKRLYGDAYPNEVGQVMLDMGVAYRRQGRFDMAHQHFVEAYQTVSTFQNVVVMVRCQYNLALLHFLQGRYDAALENIHQARIDHQQEPDSLDEAYINLREAVIRRALNQTTYAQTLFDQAMQVFKQSDRHLDDIEPLVEFVLHGADTVTVEQLTQRLTDLEQVLSYLEMQNMPINSALIHIEQGETLLRLGQFVKAAHYASLALSALQHEPLPLREAYATVLWADCQWDSQPTQAFQRYNDALALLSPNDSRLTYRCWLGIGRIKAKAGNQEVSEHAYEQAVAVLDRLRRSLYGHHHQAGFLADKQQLFDEILALLHQRTNRTQAVLHWVERAKAAALVDILGQEQQIDITIDADLRALLAERDALCWERDQHLAALTTLSQYGEIEVAQMSTLLTNHDIQHKEILDQVQRQLQSLDEQIARKQNPTYLWRQGNIADVAALSNVVDSQTVLIAYYTANEQLYAVTATDKAGDISIHPLGVNLSELSEQWQRVRRHIIKPSKRARHTQRGLSDLWQMLIAPFETRLMGKTHLLILPHAWLAQIPFGCLYDTRQSRFLIEDYSLQLAPSIGVLALCQQRTCGNRPPLLIGYSGEPSQPNYLANVSKEVHELHRYFPCGQAVLDADATLEKVMAEMPQRSLIHIAGHIIYDHAEPLHSGIPLAGQRILQASDLYVRYGHLEGAIVVLSGCESGRGRAMGNDMVGLPSAFLYAGATSVIGGLWRVSDEATTLFMQSFYQQLQLGAKGATALCHAQRLLLQSEVYAHPYYWAPFFLLGNNYTLKS